MITYEPNLSVFDVGASVILNPVNTVGVMGAGFALAIRRRYPDLFDDYRQACETFLVGDVYYWRCREGQPIIANIPTKQHWRDPSKLEYVRKSLNTFTKLPPLSFHPDNLVASPRLGCGLGNLKWEDVEPIFEEMFTEWNVVICDAPISKQEYRVVNEAVYTDVVADPTRMTKTEFWLRMNALSLRIP